MKKLIWNVYFWLVFLVLTSVGILLLPSILVTQILLFSRSLPSALRRAIRWYGWVLVCLVPFMSPVRVRYSTRELPESAIFVANHNSAIDPYLFGAIPVENSFVTSWPFRIPVYGFFMRLAGYANAEEGWDAVRSRCKALLDEGSYVTIWPEGHRSRNNQLGRFKNGAFSLAIETGRPLVPVCILGAGKILSPGERLMACGEVTLIVLDPVYPAVDIGDDALAVRQLRSEVHKIIEQTLRENGQFADVDLPGCPLSGPVETSNTM
ncbi:lysophospholipid acyltransferase family protein [Desulfosediminicola ganghwensis]|uniref:lysophospholipid acyltransferase family protein n=1 Tax=Desulfosediminicola ganghwensis TaxID=2569540 RepID=UPI0010AD640D|nr:lysophospholipid acyltransferase family protein [Desulfosediminicola ganghwensis]